MVNWVIPNMSNGSQGIEAIVAAEAAQINGLAAGILLLIFLVVLGAGYFAQERRVGAGNLLMWASIAGLITTTGAFILYLYDKVSMDIAIINIEVVMITLLITIVCAVAFLLSMRD